MQVSTVISSTMSFSEAISEGQRQDAARAARELRADLRKNGRPEPHDLGGLQCLKARYAGLPGAMFDRVLREESSKQVKFKQGR